MCMRTMHTLHDFGIHKDYNIMIYYYIVTIRLEYGIIYFTVVLKRCSSSEKLVFQLIVIILVKLFVFCIFLLNQ